MPDGAHAGGLNRIPRDGYLARLHKDERVLTKAEAAAYGKGNGGGNKFYFNFTPTAGSTEQQAEQMFDFFVKKIEEAGGAGA